MGDSVQVAPLVSNRRGWFLSLLPWWQAAALALLTAWLYRSILARLFAQWMNDPNFSHGIFVPAFAVFRSLAEPKQIEEHRTGSLLGWPSGTRLRPGHADARGAWC